MFSILSIPLHLFLWHVGIGAGAHGKGDVRIVLQRINGTYELVLPPRQLDRFFPRIPADRP